MKKSSSRRQIKWRQLPDESIQDFAVRLQALNPDCDNEEELTQDFNSGLRSSKCREFVWHRHPTSLESAIKSAQEFAVCASFTEDEFAPKLEMLGVTKDTAKSFEAIAKDVLRHKFTTIESAEAQLKRRRDRRQVYVDDSHESFNKYFRFQFEVIPIFIDKFIQLRLAHSPLALYMELPFWWRKMQKKLPEGLHLPGK